MVSNSEKIKVQLMALIKDSKNRLTPLAIEKHFLSKHPEFSKKFLAHLLKDLISEGELTYTYEFGSSFLETSFEKPVRVSDHVIIKPAHVSFSSTKNDIIITLQKGASFGSGRHPSTRLALKSVEKVLLEENTPKSKNHTALDIGTGSGVLAIAAVLMGIKKAIGLDIDPCARSEAKHNIHLNGLNTKIIIDHHPVESIQETFYLILANLRFPTLVDIHRHMSEILERSGFAILSGLKTEEVDFIKKLYKKVNMTHRYTFIEKDWASLVLSKTG